MRLEVSQEAIDSEEHRIRIAPLTSPLQISLLRDVRFSRLVGLTYSAVVTFFSYSLRLGGQVCVQSRHKLRSVSELNQLNF